MSSFCHVVMLSCCHVMFVMLSCCHVMLSCCHVVMLSCCHYRHLVRFAPPKPDAADIEDIKYYNAPKNRNKHDELLATLPPRDDFAPEQAVFADNPEDIDIEGWKNMAIKEAANGQKITKELLDQIDVEARDDAPNMTYEEIMELDLPPQPPPLTSTDTSHLEPWQEPIPGPSTDFLKDVVKELDGDDLGDEKKVNIREDHNQINIIPPRNAVPHPDEEEINNKRESEKDEEEINDKKESEPVRPRRSRHLPKRFEDYAL